MERLNTAATYAINALPDADRYQFEDALGEDDRLTDHVESFRRVAVVLADGLPDIVPAASPAIWDRIVAQTGIDQPASAPSPSPEPLQRPRRSYLLPLAAAAAALVFGILAGNQMVGSSPDMMQLAAAAGAESTSASYELASPSGVTNINASVVVAEDGTGYVVADALPALNDDRTYQLWVIVGGEVVSAGLLGSNPEVVQFRAEGDISGMAISNEVAGGVVVSENDPVALWLRDA